MADKKKLSITWANGHAGEARFRDGRVNNALRAVFLHQSLGDFVGSEHATAGAIMSTQANARKGLSHL
jgi:hypothetical protein